MTMSAGGNSGPAAHSAGGTRPSSYRSRGHVLAAIRRASGPERISNTREAVFSYWNCEQKQVVSLFNK